MGIQDHKFNNLTLYVPCTSLPYDPIYSLPTFGWMWRNSAMIQFVVYITKVISASNLLRVFKLPVSDLS